MMNALYRPVRARVAAAAAVGLLAACATPYQPLGAGGGFTDKQLAADRYRVEFRGNGNTSADLVGNMYLYRCAELTLQNKYDVFRSQRAGTAQSGAWDEPLARLAAAGPDGLTLLRSAGTTYVPVYVPPARVTIYTVSGEVQMGRYADVPSTQKAWDARALMKALEPVVKGSSRQPALTVEQVAKVALVSGTGQAGVAGSGTTLDDLRSLLGQP